MSRAPLTHSGSKPGGGLAAKRAVGRWAWRLFWREWRQHLLILGLIVVAVGGTLLGSAVATNTPPPAHAGFGSAQDMASFSGDGAHVDRAVARLRSRFHRLGVIENETEQVPGSTLSYALRSEDPKGPFVGPLVTLLAGRYPSTPSEVALTPQLEQVFHTGLGKKVSLAGVSRRVVGTVENPESLLDEFALVLPGQVPRPTQVSVLFDAGPVKISSIGPNVSSAATAVAPNIINPETIVLAIVVLGMLLIALVAVGGFTVIAQRRLRSIGMIEAIGADDKDVRRVVVADGLVVGIVGSTLGLLAGFLAWLIYRPSAEQAAHHLIPLLRLPWMVVAASAVLAVAASLFAASRPARSITSIPVVTALSGRPVAPKYKSRSVIPAIVLVVLSFVLFGVSGSQQAQGGPIALAVGLVVLIAALVLLAPVLVGGLGRLAGRAPAAARLALRDLSRYRSRSASALAAISLGVLIAVIVVGAAAARYGNVLDYVGPNLAANQVIVYPPAGGSGQPGLRHVHATKGSAPVSGAAHAPSARQQRRDVADIAASLGARQTITLETAGANLQHAAAGRNYSGPLYVATPQLLAAFGVRASSIDPRADILSGRPGFSGLTKMQLLYGDYFATAPASGFGSQHLFSCAAGSCLANPVIEEVRSLPSGTSAPNTVITEHAVKVLGLHPSTAGWLLQLSAPPSAVAIRSARLTAASDSLSIETKSSAPTSYEIIDWATLFGILLALGVLAMSLGLIRSEAGADLRTLSATGAGPLTRRAIVATTAGSLALLGAALGTAAAYLALLGWFRASSLNGGLSALGNVPLANLAFILLVMPAAAAFVAFVIGGREPAGVARSALE